MTTPDGTGATKVDKPVPGVPPTREAPTPTVILGSPTQADARGPTSDARGPTSDARSEGSLITPEQAMVHEEALRMRAFAGALALLCVVGVGAIAVLGGDPRAKALHIAAVCTTGVYAGAYYVIARDPTRYRAPFALALAYIAMVANASGFYYWGVYSPFLAVIPVSAYMYATGGSATVAYVGMIVTVISHLGLGIANLTGWIADVGLFRPGPAAGRLERGAILALVELVMIGSILLGRRARHAARAVLDEHDAAVRAIAQRDALLAEAHAEMRQIQAAAGRFTGHRVGRFVLENVLGRGAMGEVYAAVGDGGERVAIKLLAPAKLRDEAAHARFAREVKLIAGVTSPHVVRVVEVSPPDASLPYLAMELLDGRDLAAMIKDRPVRAIDEVVAIVTGVAAGLDAAHAAGIVHRDLKPQNVFAAGPAEPPTWKVLDFGVSKLVDDDAALTRDHIIGTPAYMAPEQAKNEPVDARTDVYALGVLAYRLLTGMPPVLPGDSHAMLYEVVYRMPPRPSTLVELPPALEAVLAIAIAKPPKERFASAGDFARAVAAAARGAIAPELAARADGVLARTPWGHWLRRRDRRETGGLR